MPRNAPRKERRVIAVCLQPLLLGQVCHRYGGGWFWLIMALMMAGAAVLVFLVIYALARGGGAFTGTGQTGRESPLDIARRRYAAGEIDQEEFERIRSQLER